MSKQIRDITKSPLYFEFCEKYWYNLVDYVLDFCRYTPTWQQMDVLKAIEKPGSRVAIASGHGCFGRGHIIKMFDGQNKLVENILQGDVLVGADDGKRTVHSLCSGAGMLYRCIFSNGQSHVYNDQHNLAIYSSGGRRRVSIQEFLTWSQDKCSRYWCLKNGKPINIVSLYPVGEGEYFGFELVEKSDFIDIKGYELENTGKSFISSWVLDWNLRCHPFSVSVLTATNIVQATSITFRYIDEVMQDVDKAIPWMKGFFEKQAKRYYAKKYKLAWFVLPKTASKDKPEGLSGFHNYALTFFCDEASAIPDACLDIIEAALTEPDNRMFMASQPTRPVGHFAEAMTRLAKRELPDGRIDGIWDSFTLNAEESPLVDKEYIKRALMKLGGHHSPIYQIKILGRLPDNLAGYLIPAKWCEDCQYYVINHLEDWGWVMTVDVAEGLHRDSSVINLAKVSGFGPERNVEVISCDEYLDLDEKQLARVIAAKYRELPGLTIAVDADGAGRTTILELDELGIPVERIHWGLPSHTKSDQKRYLNQRAFAHLKLREGIFEERFKGPVDKKFVEQTSKLPYRLDEKGRYQMMSKDKMRAEGIKSPDISDTCCFFYLTDYIPCGGQVSGAGSEEDEFLKMAREVMETE